MKIKMSIIMGLISASSIFQAKEQQYYKQGGTKIIINKNSLATVQVNKYNNKVAEIFISPKDEHNISHNKYDSFRVGSNGIILNNNEVAAEYIINEVINNGKSSLIKGDIEVRGQAAHVIIANPNGIGCYDCTFTNTLSRVLVSGTVQRTTDAVAIYESVPVIPKSHPAYFMFNPNRGKVKVINSKNNLGHIRYNNLSIISNGIKINDVANLSGDINLFNNYAVIHNFDNSFTKYISPIEKSRDVRTIPSNNYISMSNKNGTKIVSQDTNRNYISSNIINIYANKSKIRNYANLDHEKIHLSLYDHTSFKNHDEIFIVNTKSEVDNNTDFKNFNDIYPLNITLDIDDTSTIKNMRSGTLNYALPYVFDSSATKEEIESNEINNKTETQLRKLLKDNNFINKGEINIYSLQRVN